MRADSFVPAIPLDSRPSGLTSRIASARPGASLSSTIRVPSGVSSRGPKPVPPVVAIKPQKPDAIISSAAATSIEPSGICRRSTTEMPWRSRVSATALPLASSAGSGDDAVRDGEHLGLKEPLAGFGGVACRACHGRTAPEATSPIALTAARWSP